MTTIALSSAFGQATAVTDQGLTQHPDAKARVASLFREWACHDNAYNTTIDVRRLPNFSAVVKAEWTTTRDNFFFIETGYLLLKIDSRGRRSVFHAETLEEARYELQKRDGDVAYAVSQLRSQKYITIPMIRDLGWCLPGITRWWEQFGPGGAVPQRISANRLYRICLRVETPDDYTLTLLRNLQGNQHIPQVASVA